MSEYLLYKSNMPVKTRSMFKRQQENPVEFALQKYEEIKTINLLNRIQIDFTENVNPLIFRELLDNNIIACKRKLEKNVNKIMLLIEEFRLLDDNLLIDTIIILFRNIEYTLIATNSISDQIKRQQHRLNNQQLLQYATEENKEFKRLMITIDALRERKRFLWKVLENFINCLLNYYANCNVN